jgi:hypothetical protein
MLTGCSQRARVARCVAAPATLRDDIADIRWRLDAAEESVYQLPHREKYLLMVTGFLRRLLDLHVDRVDEVEREWHLEA